MSTTVDPAETKKFNDLANTWWDMEGAFKPLHKFNPVRLEYLKSAICAHYGRDMDAVDALKGLSVIDVGCGGGLLSEPFCRMGANVVGIDAGEKNIGAAKAHASQQNLTIDYKHTTAEDMASKEKTYDVVCAMEIVEHVADVGLFVNACASLVKPGGLLFMATLNRTAKSLLFAKIGAEYILRWLPRGTHDWRKFLTPTELSGFIEAGGLNIHHVQGVTLSPLSQQWRLSEDTSINYMLQAQKGEMHK